jgi:class 3 adenylate cyclase/tetratricopeptide (TPR) repeat protein
MNGPGQAPHASERRHLVVMFCDVVGSTRLSRHRDVESYFAVLQAYYETSQSVVTRHGGFVAQHHGDGIYIWFGYPQPREDDAVRAVRAGLDLLVVLGRVSAALQEELGEPLQVRIAAHAGEVLVASVPAEGGPLAFGHTPNFAAKLQQSARPGTMVISNALLRLVERDFEVTPRPVAVASSDRAPGPPSELVAYEVVKAVRAVGRIEDRWRTPLVGRDREIGRLQQALTAVRAGSARTLAIIGDRGLGKSRLAATLAAWATGSSTRVLGCACSRLAAGSAYRTMRVLLSTAAGIEPDDPPVVSAARLRDHVLDTLGMGDLSAAVLGACLGLVPDTTWQPPSLDPTRLAQLTADSLVEWTHRSAALAPTLLVIDDITAADPSSLAVLARLAADPPAGLFLLVTAGSAAELNAVLPAVPIDLVELTPLPEADAEALIAVVTAGAPLELHVSEQIRRQGEGIPLYLEELARTAQEVDPAALPITLSGHLQARLSAPGVDREVVATLAVAAHEVEEGLLATILHIDVLDLPARLASLLDRDLVVHLTDRGSSFRFRHGLIAEAAYGLLLNDERTRLHGHVADSMGAWQRLGHRVDQHVVGHHLDLADRPVEAFEAFLAAADTARDGGTIHEALQGYRDALDVLEKVAEPGVRDRLEIRCRIRRGVTAISARGWGADEAVEDFELCAQLCRRLGPRPERMTTMSGVYAFYLVQGKLREARHIAEEMRSWVDESHDDYSADNALGFGVLCFYEGNYTDAVTHLRRAVALFDGQALTERAEPRWLMPYDALVMALAHLANILWITGSPNAANDAADQAIARAATLPFPDGPFSMAYAKSFLASTHHLGRHDDTAARLSREVVEIGQRYGFTYWESTGAIHLAIAEHSLGARADAADVIATHAAFWELVRSRVYLPYVLTSAAQIRARTGDRDGAEAGFAAAGRLAEETGSMFYEAERLRLLAGLRAAGETRQLLIMSRELAQRQGALIFEVRAALDLARLDPDPEALESLVTALAAFPPGAGYPELNEARRLLARATLPT